MEPIFDDRDEEESVRRRKARIERMQREKQLQAKRRYMLKKLLPLVGIVLGVLVVVIVLLTVTGGRSEGESVQPNVGGQQSVEAGDLVSGVDIQEDTTESASRLDVTEEVTSQPEIVPTPSVQGEITSEATTEPTNQPQATSTPSRIPATNSVNSATYSFATTDETVTMYNSEDLISSHGILVDVSTDTIVASNGAFERISPASMTKVLTVLVAAEHVTEADLDDTFTMTLEITDYAYINDCSSVGFLNNEVVTVRDLFYGTILPSGGDAAVGLATYIAGSHEAFVDMMNEKLEELGLSETAHFTNCVGLYDKEHYCTIYDMAVIMKAAVENEMCREFLSAHTYTTTATTEHPEGIIISNWFLRRIEDKDTGGEVICAKTGYVDQSQSCAVSYGSFGNGTPYICVTIGAHSSWRCIYDHVEIYNRYVPET